MDWSWRRYTPLFFRKCFMTNQVPCPLPRHFLFARFLREQRCRVSVKREGQGLSAGDHGIPARKFTLRERDIRVRGSPVPLKFFFKAPRKYWQIGVNWLVTAGNLATGSKVRTTLQESIIHSGCENVLFSFENDHFLERPMCLMDCLTVLWCFFILVILFFFSDSTGFRAGPL